MRNEHSPTTLDWIMIFVLLAMIFALAGGCDEASNKATITPKEAAEIKAAVKGNANKITEISQQLTTIINHQEALSKSFKNQIKEVKGDINNKQNNIVNSPFMVLGLALGLVFLFLMYLYFSKSYTGFGRR